MDYVLQMEGITKQFGDAVVNRNINFNLKPGEVHTLLGENGAGKSTLMNILCGLYQPTQGRIFLKGKETNISTPAVAVRYGVGMVHQHFMLVEAMTVFENIIMGVSEDDHFFINRKKLLAELTALSEKYKLSVDFDKQITEISVGEQQRVEILKTLYRGADILILDEPTAVLTDEETEGLFQIIHHLTDENKSVIFISHKLREVMAISNRVTIMRLGEVVETVNIEDVDTQQLANKMVGRNVVFDVFPKAEGQQEPVLSLDHVDYNKKNKHSGLNDVCLTVRKGQIYGIAGVDGNGQSQLAQLATGMICPDGGTVSFKSTPIQTFKPIDFINMHVSYIPEDRNRMGLVGDMSIKENLILKSSDSAGISNMSGWWLNKKAIDANAQELCEKYDVRMSSYEEFTKNLSGGNQQKVILAREMEQETELLVAVHPTRGLDIGATQYVHSCMIKARDAGCAILLISADLDEVLRVSDVFSVFFEGKVMGTYPGENPPMEQVAMAMAGKSSDQVSSPASE